MQKLFLHIGTHKTATTWLQHFLGMNAERLEDHGYYYPKTGRVNHAQHRLGQAIFQRAKPTASIDDVPIWMRFRRELAATRYRNIVVSSEEFEWVKDPRVIRDFLPDVELNVVCYLRRQDDYLESLYGQQIRDFRPRLSTTIEEHLTQRLPYLDYGDLIGRWSAAAERVHVRVFDRRHMVDGDIGRDFLTTIGLPDLRDLAPPSGPVIDHKASLSLGALEFLRHCNRLDLTEGYHNRLVNQVIRLDKLAKPTDAPRERLLGFAQRQKIMADHQSGNRALARQHPEPTGLADLFPAIADDAAKFAQAAPVSDFQTLLQANALVPLK